ncbi:MAG: putative transporter [Bacteroidales bacterium]|jgi:putative transport protein|nr:putative transporter [Bacteroidales bacterium]
MEEIIKLFTGSGTASTLLFLSLTGMVGIALGRVKVGGVGLGIAGVLFIGLIAGHFGARVDEHVLHFVKEFGLILFIYSIGLEVGPRFVSSLRNNGLKINLLAAALVLMGVACAVILKFTFNIDTHVIVGILCGAVTNTPSLGAAQQVIAEQIPNSGALTQQTGMAYAIAYPIGVIGIIITMLLIRAFFKISVKDERERYQRELAGLSGQPEAVNLEIVNQALVGQTVGFMRKTLDGEFALSRMCRRGNFFMPEDKEILQLGDRLYGVSTADKFDDLRLKVGPLQETGEVEITGRLGMEHIVFTNKKLAGKTIKQIGVSRRFPVNITRIFRAGVEFIATEDDTVEFGDTIRIVGERARLKEVATFLGDSNETLAHPNIIPIMLGILAGVLIGSIPIAIPGLPAPAKLGLAGGPLVVALYLGHKGRISKLSFYMTPSANLFIRELGIVLFLACVGLSAGGGFVNAITNGGYIWLLYGAVITFLPVLAVGLIARFMKINYLTISGLLAGAMTDPPALEFANSQISGQAQSTAYATVYPLTMFLRVLTAQIMTLTLLG